jgi:hypothetical protein
VVLIILVIYKNQLNMRISFKMIKNCCINTTIRNLAILLKKLFIVSLPILIFSCSSAKKEGETIIKKKDTEINVEKRAREAADKNPLFSSSRNKGGGNFEFSTSNVLWRASLDSLDDIPLTTVDYSGGVILTDWYNISKDTNQAKDVKIQVRFLSNEVTASSIKVTGHIKECASSTSCSVAKTSDSLNDQIKNKILDRARIIKIDQEKNK